tara:strand:+ start:793 stop:1026 length:234 start_codon:yes stop_codon:yes gene_type:complete
MSANSMVLADLQRGLIIGTDNATCSRYGVNKIPDVMYQLRHQLRVSNPELTIKTLDKYIIRNGKRKKVAMYRLVGNE